MKVQNTLYLTDKKMYLKYKDTIYEEKIPKNIIVHGFIANSKEFIKYFEKIINKYNINKSLFGGSLKIIVNPTLTQFQINYLKELFAYFNFNKIIIEYTTKCYKLNESNAYLNMEESYSILSYIDEYKRVINLFIPHNLFLSKNDYAKYIKYRIDNKDLYLVGNEKFYENIFSFFENDFGNKTYIFFDSPKYFINRT